MAKQTVFIPDGDLCCDCGHLGCMFERFEKGFWHCAIFHAPLSQLNDYYLDGQWFRARKKISACLKAKTNDGGKGYLITEAGKVMRKSEVSGE